MEELQVIKKELTLIKTQIDGLLDSLDRMDTQRSDHKGEALIYKDSGIRWVQDWAGSSDVTSRPFSGNKPLSDSCLISSTIPIRMTQNRSCMRLRNEAVLCHRGASNHYLMNQLFSTSLDVLKWSNQSWYWQDLVCFNRITVGIFRIVKIKKEMCKWQATLLHRVSRGWKNDSVVW